MKKYIIGTFVLLHSYVIIAQIQIKCVDTIYYDPASGIYDIATFQPSVSGTDQYDLKYEIFEINKGNCVENHCRTDSIVWTISADNQIYNCSHLVKIT